MTAQKTKPAYQATWSVRSLNLLRVLTVPFAVSGDLLPNLVIVLSILAAIVVVVVAGPENLSRTENKQVQEENYESTAKLVLEV